MFLFPYYLLHILAFAGTSLLAEYAWHKRQCPGALRFAITMRLWSIWIIANALELAASDLPTKLFWANVHYIGLMGAPVAWFAMVCRYTGFCTSLNARRMLLLCVIPAVTVVLAFTDGTPGLIRSSVYLDTDREIASLDEVYGPGYWAAMGYTYLVGLAGALVLLIFADRVPSRQKAQPYAILAGGLVAAPVNLAFAVGFSPIPSVDLTPVLFGLLGVVMGWGIFRFHVFDVLPLDRGRVLTSLTDAVITMDGSLGLLETNQAARRIPGLSDVGTGRSGARQLLRAMPSLGKLLDGSATAVVGTLYVDGIPTRYEATISDVAGADGKQTGRVILVRNVTRQLEDTSRRVSQQMAVATMQERERLAGEVGTGVNQVLGYMVAEAKAIQEMLALGDTRAARSRVQRLSVVAREALIEAREFAMGAWRGGANVGDFLAAVEAQVQRFGRASSARVRLTATPATEVTLEPMAEAQLLRVLQDALSRVRARACTRVDVMVEVRDGSLLLSVEDDGSSPSEGVRDGEQDAQPGLSSMRERMRGVGGRLDFSSTPGGRTRLELALPLFRERDAGLRSVLLGDEDPVFLEGLRYLAAASGMILVGASLDGYELIEIAVCKRPDVVLVSMGMPGCNGIEVTRRINQELPGALVVLLASTGDEVGLLEAVEAGASGYILRSDGPAQIMETLGALERGHAPLSPGLTAALRALSTQNGWQKHQEEEKDLYLTTRQIEILGRVARGKTYKDIAAELYLSEPTIKYHMAQILERLGVKNREEAIVLARRQRLIADDQAASEAA